MRNPIKEPADQLNAHKPEASVNPTKQTRYSLFAPMRSTSQAFNGNASARARRYPLVTHWMTDKSLCSSTARLDTETLTTVASNWERRDPRIATETILHTRGSSRFGSGVWSGKGF